MVRRSVEASQVSTAAIRCDSSFFSLFLRIKIRPTHPDRQQPDSNLCTQFDMHAMANKEEHRGEGGAASAALVNDRSIGKDNKNNKRSLALSLQSHNLQPWSYPPKFFYPRSANAVPLRYCVSSMFRCEVVCTFTLCENLDCV